ncbi:transcription-repair coupling factor [Balneolaceae bacterium ANBcel3]|nr:transcription-repair coupling factor [Balneolaceae bacterium ANBcel3]
MSLQQIAQVFSRSFSSRSLSGFLQPGSTIQLEHFSGSSVSLAIAEMAAKSSVQVVVAPDTEQAQCLYSDLESLDCAQALYYPPGGLKPFEKGAIKDTTISAQRSDILDRIQQTSAYILVTSAEALFDKVASAGSFNALSVHLKKNSEMDPDNLASQLVDQDYQSVTFVNEPGEFARRGGIIDIYPFSGNYPVRVEFFGNEIDSIREFDPNSQRSVAFLDQIRLIPNMERVQDTEKVSIFQFIPDNSPVWLIDYPGTLLELKRLYYEAETALDEETNPDDEPMSSLKSPEAHFLHPEELPEQLHRFSVLHSGTSVPDKKADYHFRLDARPQPVFNSSIKLLRKDLAQLSDQNIETWILCDNEGQRNRFEELLGEPGEPFRYRLAVSSLSQGFILPEAGIAVYTDHQIFNRYHRPKTKQRPRRGGISFKELQDLNIGDFVVHVDHGIGVFAGFRKIHVRGAEQESVVLRYKDDSILYVNVSSLYKLQKYSGKDGTAPKVTKLGSGEWARKKAKTKKRVKDIARELIQLYAQRKSQKAWAFSPDQSMQTELEASFMFEETPDQAQAIEDVKQDMMTDTPMDRLVCGDVGFGKTEVAVRAAFKAVLDGKQVAVMVPTTILADQHWKTFKSRMKDFPVNIEVISRFRSKAQQKEILERTKKGNIDILIGTHRIASKDVVFQDLGLLILDEEQRFGVSVKEALKKFRASMDVLTLTATPIPRTLQFSLMGARDLSIINTPPPNRQPVQTEIHSFNPQLIQEAITKEMNRGGQVFFIHNRVKNIEETAGMIRNLVPNVRVQFAHGQMTGSQLEKIILDFYEHSFDVLVSTNIVENGIDIANANTIIINQANQFGLSELHQLRGRVGRSNRKAFCYLITPPLESLTLESRRRLLALEEYSDLGSGFNIAMRDLDIRGAGDILGAEQSGFVNEVGFEMYNKILNEAVQELKSSEFAGLFDSTPDMAEKTETTVEFDYSALLPSGYVNDNVERLNLYRRLSGSNTLEEIDEWKEEIADRFGPLPEPAIRLIEAAQIKVLASQLLLTKVIIRSNRMWIECPAHSSPSGALFFDQGGLQHILSRLEELRPGKFQLIQKKESIRFAIQIIPDPKSAKQLLMDIQPARKTETDPNEHVAALSQG